MGVNKTYRTMGNHFILHYQHKLIFLNNDLSLILFFVYKANNYLHITKLIY